MDLKILIYHAKQCNPNACTGTKLKKMGLAKVFYSPKKMPWGAIVLNPFSEKALSPEDRELIEYGLVALDCSWKHAQEVFKRLRKPVQNRVLPLLVAANPINYGKISKLTTAEAISASLYILGFKEEAEEVMSKFKWGPQFITLNLELLNSYADAKNSKEILEIQQDYFDLKEAEDGEIS